MKDSLLLVTDGLIDNEDGLALHPDLFLWQSSLLRRKQQWFKSSKHNPLSLYAALLDTDSATLLASKAAINSAKQYWVASPYHAQLTRDSVRIMPETMLSWCAEDAHAMCDLLNPWLKDEGMCLHTVGSALLLACDRIWDVYPPSFPSLSGAQLPNRHPKGSDGGHWMRLQSEIQMLLHQSPLQHRRQQGNMAIHGLWFWGGRQDCLPTPTMISVATRHAYLQSVVDARNAKLMVTESNHISLLLHQDKKLPKHVFLLGEGYMVDLESNIWHQFHTHKCSPHDIASELKGVHLLQSSDAFRASL